MQITICEKKNREDLILEVDWKRNPRLLPGEKVAYITGCNDKLSKCFY